MKHNLRTLAVAVSLAITAGPAMANDIDFHGYLRSGLGVSGGGSLEQF